MGNVDCIAQFDKELQDFVKSVTAPYKYPRWVEFVEIATDPKFAKIPMARLLSKEYAQERRALIVHFDYLTRYANDIIFLSDESGRILEA